MHTCMYVCMCVCMYVCMCDANGVYVCVCVCVCVSLLSSLINVDHSLDGFAMATLVVNIVIADGCGYESVTLIGCMGWRMLVDLDGWTSHGSGGNNRG